MFAKKSGVSTTMLLAVLFVGPGIKPVLAETVKNPSDCIVEFADNGEFELRNSCSQDLEVTLCVANVLHPWRCDRSSRNHGAAAIGIRAGGHFSIPEYKKYPGSVHYAACPKGQYVADWDSVLGRYTCK